MSEEARPTVWHYDKNMAALVKQLIEGLKPDRFVETGTNVGDTIVWLAERYPGLEILSTEINTEFYLKARERCAGYRDISLWLMSSPEFLKDIYPTLKQGLSLFWLDAHWYSDMPLRDECKIISTLERYIVLIDDMGIPGTDFVGEGLPGGGFLTPQYVADILGNPYVPDYPPLPPQQRGYGLYVKGLPFKCPLMLKEFRPGSTS